MKNFSVKNGFGFGIVIFAVAAIIALPLRTVQFFTVLEGGTGFFSSVDTSVYMIYAVLSIAIIALVIIGISKRKKLDYSYEEIKRPGLGILSVTAAVGIAMDAVNCVSQIANNTDSFLFYSAEGQMTVNSEKFVFTAQAVFAIISAVYFLISGTGLYTGKNISSKLRLLSLSPVLWSVFRMVYRFTRTISYLRVSDLTFEMVMLMFMILFFMALAQANSKIGSKNVEWKVAAYGLSAALLALICFVPRFIVAISGNSHLLYSYSGVEYCDIAIALFILATVLTRITDRIQEEESETETKEIIAEE